MSNSLWQQEFTVYLLMRIESFFCIWCYWSVGFLKIMRIFFTDPLNEVYNFAPAPMLLLAACGLCQIKSIPLHYSFRVILYCFLNARLKYRDIAFFFPFDKTPSVWINYYTIVVTIYQRLVLRQYVDFCWLEVWWP